jgi:hypothetical protein
MRGLKNLRITIWGCTIYGVPRDWVGIRQLLDLLKRIERPRDFVVVIEAEELAKEYVDAPFRLEWFDDDGTMVYG